MYCKEEKQKAIELYISVGEKITPVIHTLGYPSRHTLERWYLEYQDNGGCIPDGLTSKYSAEEKQAAIDFYTANDMNIVKTVKETGIPRSTIADWLADKGIVRKPDCISGTDVVKCSDEHKLMAVLEAERDKETVSRITAKYEISDTTLRQWQKQLLRRECSDEMPTVKKKKESSPDIQDAVSETTEDLHAEVIRLRHENETQADLLHQARLERDVLAATIEVLKKDRGINPEKLTNPEKARVIDALRKCYELKELLCS